MLTLHIYKKKNRSLIAIGTKIAKLRLSFAHSYIGAPKEHISITGSKSEILKVLEFIK